MYNESVHQDQLFLRLAFQSDEVRVSGQTDQLEEEIDLVKVSNREWKENHLHKPT